ncbi:MAG: hypothetical protein KGJ07_00300 [Patescibacteria group bacterium]|nr:hypothetical protein [Patescibacteria group bacterium]
MTEETNETKEIEAKNNDEQSKETAEKKDDDSIKWRAKYKHTKEELETAKLKADSEKQELSSKMQQTDKAKQMYEQKYVEAEIKAHAVAAGIKDVEFVKLIDKADIKIDENGNLTGVEKAITDLKTRKPDWFGTEKKISSSGNQPFTGKDEPKPIDARKMSKEDWKKNKPQFMAGQF